MALTIATNTASLTTQKYLNIASTNQSSALATLSSGTKITKAADDAAGSAISTKLNVKSSSLSKAIDNGNQAVSMLQTAESGMETISDILTRLKELATEAASANNATDLSSLQSEREQLEQQINNIADGTKYGATSLLSGGGAVTTVTGTDLTAGNGINGITAHTGAASGAWKVDVGTVSGGSAALTLTDANNNSQTIQVTVPSSGNLDVEFSQMGVSVNVNNALGSNNLVNTTDSTTFTVGAGTSLNFEYQLGDTSDSYNQVTATIGGMSTTNLGLSGMGDWTTGTAGDNAQLYLDKLNETGAGVDYVNSQRSAIGASQNQIGYQISNLESTLTNTESAASTIKDTDYAASMSEFTKYQVMTQAGVAMLTQSNQLPQQILSLLKG
jgi:flagellin